MHKPKTSTGALAMLIPRELVSIAPVAPDFHVCDPEYGTRLSPADCNYAGDTYLPQGQNSVPVYTNNPRVPNRLPYSVAHGELWRIK